MGQDIKNLKLRMQRFLDDFVLWTETWGFEINPTKAVMQVYWYTQENELKFQYFESTAM